MTLPYFDGEHSGVFAQNALSSQFQVEAQGVLFAEYPPTVPRAVAEIAIEQTASDSNHPQLFDVEVA